MQARREEAAPRAAPSGPGPGPAAGEFPPPAGPRGTPRRATRLVTIALLATAIVAAFWPVLGNDWLHLDDPDYVTAQPHVLRGLRLDSALWFFTHLHSGNWHPLTSWSHMVDVQLFGTRAAGHHAVNLLLHLLNAVLLVLVLFRMTGAWWRSLAVGALFALHPLRVESVAWVAERKDVLSGLFFLLTIGAYHRWVERPGRGRYAALVLALVLGLMSKPMLVTLPFVLVLLDLWPLGRLRPGRRPAPGPTTGPGLAGLLAEKWPLFALAAGSAVVTFLVQRHAGAVTALQVLPLPGRVANAALSYWRYVGDTLWPTGLAVFYSHSPTTNWAGALAGGAGLVAVTAWGALRWRGRPYLATGWFWYVGMLVPVIGLVQVGGQAYADRYTYLPSIGLAIVVVWLAGDLVSRSRAARVVTAVALVAALGALSLATWRQAGHWKDDRTLYAHAVAVTRNNPAAHELLGATLLWEGETEAAIAELGEAVRLAPRFSAAHYELGLALASRGEIEEAVRHLETATRLEPADPDAAHGLGVVLRLAGREQEAEEQFRRALRLTPRSAAAQAEAHAQIGSMLALRGRLDEAADRFRQALALSPGAAELRFKLASALVLGGRPAEAAGELREAVRLKDGWAEALNALAWLLATTPDPSVRAPAEALALAREASKLTGDEDPEILDTVAAAEAATGRFAQAAATAHRAADLAGAARAGGLARLIRGHARLYESGRPCVEDPADNARPPD